MIKFGTDYSHSDYVIPIAIIELYDEKRSSNTPYETLYIRMGGAFSTAIRAAYDDAQGIVGAPLESDANIAAGLKSVGENFLGALQKQIVQSVIGAAGMAASGGSTGRGQIEFLSRVFLSNFQQVIYRGPSFRLFTLPFTMKPTSKEEATAMRDIISTLKIASVPKLGATNIRDAFAQVVPGGSVNEGNFFPSEDENFVTEKEANSVPFAPASPITFGYPDICKFKLALYQYGSEFVAAQGLPYGSEFVEVFESNFCVFESVVADYGGSSNKMTFFEDGYFPTEVTLTVNLKELEFETTKSVFDYATKGYQIS